MQAIAALLLIWLANVAISSNTPVCKNGFTLINNKCLRLFYEEVIHRDAELSCRNYGATLVTVKNAQDNQDVATIAGSAKLIWLGLSCFEDSFGKCFWDDASGSANSYNSFSGGYPNVQVGQCVYYSTQGVLAGKWISEDCERYRMPYICELPTTYQDSCSYNYNGYCYTFSSTAVPFVTAQKICELSCGNLVSIHSPNELQYIVNFAPFVDDGYFIGATWKNNYSLSWLDDSPWDYDRIDPSFSVKVGYCFTIYTGVGSKITGSWYSVDNWEIPNQYICKIPAGVPCSPAPPVTPTPNLSNCNGPRMMYSGVFTSPNYPNNYDNNEDCTYLISTLGPYGIFLFIAPFSTEHKYDVVTIYDGPTTSHKVLAHLSGEIGISMMTSSGNSLLVTFKSDKTNTFSGFSARFYSTRLIND
ncbi:C-type LECtin [Caenorhabditis elegans]|uniref:C-type LECtin n=1 Tax=Caenorhabditis elegans TaxID=6239 RepID=O16660_CAEEL|nr:C-type LECtin [Caenorhabditis elegans]CCD62818.1 C-type LECtin [Caenorhabditis elegans]|eukprot:NP_493725.2 C-type LECtin [Caenorhabditis elegans]